MKHSKIKTRTAAGGTRSAARRGPATSRQAGGRSVLESVLFEQRRFGHLLHDSLCQELAAISFACEALQQRLEQRSSHEADAIHRIADALSQAMAHVKEIVREMDPVADRPDGLIHALRHLAQHLSAGGVCCVFEGDDAIRVHDATIAANLYRIAEYMVTTAIRLCRATEARIALAVDGEVLRLSVSYSGGAAETPPRKRSKPASAEDTVLSHRAHGIGATLARRQNRAGCCTTYCEISNVIDGGEALADLDEHHG